MNALGFMKVFVPCNCNWVQKLPLQRKVCPAVKWICREILPPTLPTCSSMPLVCVWEIVHVDTTQINAVVVDFYSFSLQIYGHYVSLFAVCCWYLLQCWVSHSVVKWLLVVLVPQQCCDLSYQSNSFQWFCSSCSEAFDFGAFFFLSSIQFSPW